MVAVVRNGTGQAVTGVRMDHIVRDMSATPQLAATPQRTSDGAPVFPLSIPPGGIGLAVVPVGDPAADDAVRSFTVTTGSPDDTLIDLAIPRAGIVDGTLTGIITATAIDAALDPEIVAVCIGADGTVTGGAAAALAPRRIDPYRSVPLSLPLPSGCDGLLATASAHH